MGSKYDTHFTMVKFVSFSQIVVALILVGITELMLRGMIEQPVPALAGAGIGETLRLIFIIISLALLVMSFLMKRTIRTMNEGPVLSLMKFQLKMIKQRGNSSAIALLIVPSAMCEMIVILGFVLFILVGGNREVYYPFYLAGLAMMAYIFPADGEKENLIGLDKGR